MKNPILILGALLFFATPTMAGEKEEAYLKQTMIPQARALLLRIGQTNDLPSATNQVHSYRVDYFDDGLLAKMQLTNGWVFRYLTSQRETNVSASHLPGEMEATYLKEKMIPLAQAFFEKIGQTNNLPLNTNQIKNYKVDYFDNRPGCTADLRLTDGTSFSFRSETNKTEIWVFQRSIKTYYGFGPDAPKGKIIAVKALNLKNKLNKEKALALAKKYFKMVGRQEENFHPPEFIQCYWSGEEGGPLPYYEITWYRKDVDVKTLAESGNINYRAVIIEVSGIDSSLISYSKFGMPIGSDF